MRRNWTIILFACQSFAWFTSKDEVTNRLTASANYGVSAIENYVPPKQFTPGQTVTKEEAVVNTGSIDAFVKQKITGDMKVSVEIPTVSAPTKATASNENYLELDSQERFGTYEAGSTLAWAPDGSKYRDGDKMKDNGIINDYGIDGATAENKGFKPDKTGLYVFRRAIVKGSEQSYEYVGYYYVAEDENDPAAGGKYYKLYGLSVPKSVLDTETDGLLKAAPTASFSRKIETTIEKVDMTFLEPSDTDANGNAYGDYRLKVQYSTDEIVNDAVVDAARQKNAKDVYDNYKEYLDYLQGKTTYVKKDSWTYPAGTAGDPVTARTNDLRALASDNATGLIDYDKYFVGTQTPVGTTAVNTPSTTLEDFSYKRLEDLKYGNNYDQTNYGNAATAGNDIEQTGWTNANTGNAAAYGLQGLYNYYSPVMSKYNSKSYGTFTPFNGTGEGTVNHGTVDTVEKAWAEAQKEADRSRQIINTGRNAANDLAKYYADVIAAIGRATNDDGTENGLKFSHTADSTNVGDNRWSANMLYDLNGATPENRVAIDAPTVEWNQGDNTNQINFKNSSKDLNTNDKIQVYLTADTVFEKRFEDVGKTGSEFGDHTGSNTPEDTAGYQVMFKDVTNPYDGTLTDDTLKNAWDAYVRQIKRKMLIDEKIKVVQGCIQDGTGKALDNAILTETNVSRTIAEAERALSVLEAEKIFIYADYEEAKETYETEAKKIAAKIEKMNELQTMVDAANKEYDSYITSDSTNYPYVSDFTSNPFADVATVIKVTGSDGTKDSPVEDYLEDCLKHAFGVAHRKAAPAPTYTVDHVNTTSGDSDTTNVDTVLDTYSFEQTKADVDKYTDTTTGAALGTTAFSITDFVNSEFKGDGNQNEVETAVQAAPYYRLVEVDTMMDKRKSQYEDKEDKFETAASEMALFNKGEGNSAEGIILYVGLGEVITNAPGANDANKWQYVGDATDTKTAKEFDFGYTSILDAGETSSQLIKYVKFDEKVTQKDFLDMTFDINVGVESAQVAYEGTIAGAQAARSTLNPIIPSQESYTTSSENVAWVSKTGNAGPDGVDPKPKTTPETPTTADKTIGTKYTVSVLGDHKTATISSDVTPVISATVGKTLNYKLAVDGDPAEYYGDSTAPGATFYKLDGADVTSTSPITLEKVQYQVNSANVEIYKATTAPVTNANYYVVVGGEKYYSATDGAGDYKKLNAGGTALSDAPEDKVTVVATYVTA